MEFRSRNKVLANNIFAIPVLTPTFGILEWTKEELEHLDIKTRKIQHVPAFISIAISIDCTVIESMTEEG